MKVAWHIFTVPTLFVFIGLEPVWRTNVQSKETSRQFSHLIKMIKIGTLDIFHVESITLSTRLRLAQICNVGDWDLHWYEPPLDYRSRFY